MADSLPPVSIRVARPFATEDELLENELETLTRTSITLLGAQPRPPGLVLRFELLLASGQVLVRGEGRVVGYRPDAHYGTGGLTVRFTRLDTRSKAVVDKAAALRERRRPAAVATFSEPEAASAPASLLAPGDERPAGWRPSPPPMATPSRASSVPPASSTLALDDERAGGSRPSAPPMAAASRASLAPPVSPEAAAADGAARLPPDRDALLERLRQRSRALGEMFRLLDRRR